MSQGARLDSIEKLKDLRVVLALFMDAARTGLLEAEAEIQRLGLWLKNDQVRHWKSQMMTRGELVARAKIALNQKKLTRTPLGGHYSCVDEEKALQAAKRRLAEAEEKLANVQKWCRRLDEEVFEYKGQTQALARAVDSDLPVAVAQIDRMLDSLESYAALRSPGSPDLAGGGSVSTVAREGELDSFPMDSILDVARLAEYQALRLLTPSREQRGRAVLATLSADLAGRPLRRRHLDGLGRLNSPLDPPAPATRIVLGAGGLDADRLYLERKPPVDSQDSGWYLGPAGKTVAEVAMSVRIDDLTARWPDWSVILNLPVGSLAVVRGGLIEAVIDGDDSILWPPSTGSADKRRQQ